MNIDRHKFEDYNRESIGQIAPQTLIILPVGSVEQHGPHLPVGTDYFLVDYFAHQIVKRSYKSNVIMAPTVCYGSSQHHAAYPGVMSLRGTTLHSVLCDLADSLVLSSGFRNIFFLNGHGGNEHIIGQAVRDLVARHENIVVGAASYWNIAKKAMQQELSELGAKSHIAHAGISETSMMLALREGMVDKEAMNNIKKDNDFNKSTIRYLSLRMNAFVLRSNYMEALDGCSEVPLEASRELGDKLIEVIVGELVEFFYSLTEHP